MLTRLDGLEGEPRGLFWGELSKSAPRLSFSTDMSLYKKGGYIGPSTPRSSRGSRDPQGLSPLPCGPGLGCGRRPWAEGARGRGTGNEPSKQPHPGGDVDVHLPSALERLPWGDGAVSAPETLLGPLASALPRPTPSPCCLEKIFFCRRSRGILSMTGLRKVTWGEGSPGEDPCPLPGSSVQKPLGAEVCTCMFWGFRSLWHCIV